MKVSPFQIISRLVLLVLLSEMLGCRQKSERDVNSESKMTFNSKEWKNGAAEDITIRIVAVLQRPASQLSWYEEREGLQLTDGEKEAIANKGITGKLQVVNTAGRGSGSTEVRMVIIQKRPLQSNARLPVPSTGSSIYIEMEGELRPLSTNSPASALVLEIFQEKKETSFFMDYPRDRTRYGGGVFWWDENGSFHGP